MGVCCGREEGYENTENELKRCNTLGDLWHWNFKLVDTINKEFNLVIDEIKARCYKEKEEEVPQNNYKKYWKCIICSYLSQRLSYMIIEIPTIII